MMPNTHFFRRHVRRLLTALLALTLTVVVANCGRAPETADSESSVPAAEETTNPGTLIFGAVGQPVTLESGNVIDGYSIDVQQQIYNYLLGHEPGTTDLIPELATEWSSSEDGLTWTFTLREGVTFQDGTPFNAEAVVFNVNRWWDPDFEFGFRDAGKLYEGWGYLFSGFKDDEDSILADVQAVDEFTVVFELAKPFAAFPAAIASGYFGIASPTAIQEAGADYGRPASIAVGTGPFVFEEWRSGDRIILSRFEDYWEDWLPNSEQLVFRFVEDPAARLVQLRSGTLDFTVNLTPDQLPEIESDPNIEPVFRPSFNVGYLTLNPGYEPLATPAVRRAVAQAINKSAIVEAFWGELATTDGHFVPPSLENYTSEEVGDYAYDPEAARAAIADAGYPDGFDLDLWYPSISGLAFPTPKPVAEALAAELSQIGIRVNLQTKDWGAYLEDRNTPPGFQSYLLAWAGDYGDPDNFLYPNFGEDGSKDLGGYQNQELAELLDQARFEPDSAQRESLYQDIDVLLFEEALRIPIVHAKPLLAQHVGLEGWVPSPLGSEAFATVSKS
ncbi:MAG: ABC transporter substrate-binding protein [Cyanobacteria bacterium J06638_22]